MLRRPFAIGIGLFLVLSLPRPSEAEERAFGDRKVTVVDGNASGSLGANLTWDNSEEDFFFATGGLAVHGFVLRRWSVGGFAAGFYDRSESSLSRGYSIGSIFGYYLPLSECYGMWPRFTSGVFRRHDKEAGQPTLTSRGAAFQLDLPFVYHGLPHTYFAVGPVVSSYGEFDSIDLRLHAYLGVYW